MKKIVSVILTFVMMLSTITIVQVADLSGGGYLNVYAEKDAEGLSYEAAMAYKGVIDDMQEKYGDYQGYDGPWETMCTGFGLAMLIDFDNNGTKELLIGCGTINPDEDRLFYEVYGYENGLVKYTHQYCCDSMDLGFDLGFRQKGSNIYTVTSAGSNTICDGSIFYGTLVNGKWEVIEYYSHGAGACDGEWCGLEGKDVYRINGADTSTEEWMMHVDIFEVCGEYDKEGYDSYYAYSDKGTELAIETLNSVISSKAQPEQSGSLSGVLKDVYIKDSLGYDIQCLILDLESPQTLVISGTEGDPLEITGVEEIQLSIKNFDESMIGKKIKVVNYSDAFEGHTYYHIRPVVMLNAEVDILYEQTSIKVMLDGQNIGFDQQPVIVNDRTLVPMRAIFEALGAYVDWDGTTRMVTATKGSNKISISIGSNQLNVNGIIKTLDVAAQIINDRTLVPVRAISEAFNCDVEWDGASRSVLITTKETSFEISNEETLQKLTVFYNQYPDMYVETQCNGYASIKEDKDIQQINTQPKHHYFFDIDSDGMDELIIYGEATNTQDLIAVGYVYSIWKVQNNEITPIISKIGHNGRNGKHYSTVTYNNQIMILESAGMSNSSGYFGEYRLYQIENNVPVVKYELVWDSNEKCFINGTEITFEDSQIEKEKLLNTIGILTENN